MSGLTFKYKNVGGPLRPIIPVEIGFKGAIRYEVLVDSGADFCIFDAEVAQAIGIDDFESGDKFTFGGITGKEETAYRHTVTLKVRDVTYQTKVCFSDKIRDDGIGIVGQKGFFDRFSIKFDYSEKKIILRKKSWA